MAVVSAFSFAPFQAHTYPGTTVELQGRGWGHGRGMGQYGALGYALNYGWDHRAVLNYFYGGTTEGTIGYREISVRMKSFDLQPTILMQERGHLSTAAAEGSYFALKAVLVESNVFAIEQAPDCAGPWTPLTTVPAGAIRFAPATYGEDRAEMIQLCEPDGSRRWVRGDAWAVDDAGRQRTVNNLALEEYLRGVVPRESPASWGDLGDGAGMQALKAQAVTARSYAHTEARDHYANTCDTTSCQVYGGRALLQGGIFRDLEDPRTDGAIAQTSGQIRLRSEVPARTEFSSSTGGWSAGGTFPPVADEGDTVSNNPNHYWRASVPVNAVESAWPSIGRLLGVTITRRNGLGDWGGRAIDLRIDGTAGSVSVSAAAFRIKFGLKSDWFAVISAGGYDPLGWSAWEPLNGTVTSGADVSSWGPGRLDVFVRNNEHSLWHKWWDGYRWSEWESLGGELTADPGAVSWSYNRIDVFAHGIDDALWHKWWDGYRWSEWESLGGTLASGPAVSSWSPGRLDVFVRGIDDALWHKWWDGHGWSEWERLGGQLSADPTAVSWGHNRIDVFVKGIDNALWHKWWDGSNWSHWESLGGQLRSGPDVASWNSNRLDIFAVGPDGSLYHKWWDEGWSVWESLGGQITADPGAVSWARGRMDVFGTGIDNRLWHRWY